nr:hypothetical protein [Candidatus Sigynarchaeota archaeon]
EHLSVEERKSLGIGQLPGPLNEALDRLEQDKWVKSVLGGDIVDLFLVKKRQEWADYLKGKGNSLESEVRWEYDRYLERV